MAVFRIEKTRDYTVMSNYHLRDMSLSLKAKGLLSLMLSLPENWDYTMKGLARICKDGIDSISGGIRELEAHGYLIRSRVRSANGQLGSIEYTILEQPKAPSPTQKKPLRENPVQANPLLDAPIQENPAQLSKDMDKELKELQKQFMPEDTKAGLIQSFLDNFKGTQVCSKLIYAEALNHPFDEPKQWEIREINEIMNNSIEGWRPFSNPRSFAKYGRQRGWERIPPPDNEPSATGSNLTDGFRELTEEEARQMELPF